MELEKDNDGKCAELKMSHSSVYIWNFEMRGWSHSARDKAMKHQPYK